MEITGTIIQAMPEVSGISKAGNAWKKREYVIENNEGQYPRKVCFTCFGDNADRIVLAVGQRVKVSFDLESREYNGRWYTEVRAWRAESLDAAQAPVQPTQNTGVYNQGGTAVPPPPQMPAGGDEEFPF